MNIEINVEMRGNDGFSFSCKRSVYTTRFNFPSWRRQGGETNDDINDHRGDVVTLFVHLPYKAPPTPTHPWADLSRRQLGGGGVTLKGGGVVNGGWGVGWTVELTLNRKNTAVPIYA